MTTVNDTILTPEQMLANAQKAVASGKTAKNMSAVQKLLAGRELNDTINLSPVARLVAERQKEVAARSQNFQDSDEFLQMKAKEISRRLAIYSRIPGMEAAYAAAEQEGKEILQKIVARQKKVADEIKAKQEELAAKERQVKLLTPDELLKRARSGLSGTTTTTDSDKEKAVEALLAKARGSTLNTSA